MKIIKKIFLFMFYSNVRIRFYVNFLIRLEKKKKLKIVRFFIREHLRKKYHILIGRNSTIGSLNLPHPHNVAIGRGTEVGNNCTLYHDVSVGRNYDGFPKIGDNVIVYMGARIIGGITIGNNAIIGANAVVTKDVPENAIVAGIPARIIGYRNDDEKFY